MSANAGFAAHWEDIYAHKPSDQVSWHQGRATTSLRLITAASDPNASVVDVGAGASNLVDDLLINGYTDVTVLDISAHALAAVQARLAGRSGVTYVVEDLLRWHPERTFDVWHDRAVFHFLTAASDRQRYVATVTRTVVPGGVVVLGTFAADGPTSCSGLPTARYDSDALAAQFDSAFVAEHGEREDHHAPGGTVQPFTWVVLRRRHTNEPRSAATAHP